MQSSINQRFKDAVDALINKGDAKTQVEIAIKIGWHQTSLNSVYKNNKGRSLPYKRAIAFCNTYGINQEWLLDGVGEMFSDKKAEAPKKPSELNAHDFSVAKLKDRIKHLETTVKHKEELIKLQQTLIETLQKGSTQVKPSLRKN